MYVRAKWCSIMDVEKLVEAARVALTALDGQIDSADLDEDDSAERKAYRMLQDALKPFVEK